MVFALLLSPEVSLEQGFCNSGAKLQSSTVVLRLNFSAKLKICASIAPPSQSPEPLWLIKTNEDSIKHFFDFYSGNSMQKR